MKIEEFVEKLAEAGTKFDGHVTHGSLTEQMKIITEYWDVKMKKQQRIK